MAGPFDPIDPEFGDSPLDLIAECETVAAIENLRSIWQTTTGANVSDWPPQVGRAWQERHDELFRSGRVGSDDYETRQVIGWLRDIQQRRIASGPVQRRARV